MPTRVAITGIGRIGRADRLVEPAERVLAAAPAGG
jgi:hypothetical protein